MIETREFLLHARIDQQLLDTWIEAGWLLPRRQNETSQFAEIDLARAQLIRDLRDDLGVNDEGVAVILDLLDQLHGVRRRLWQLCTAISAQPEDMRQQVATAMRAAVSRDESGNGRAGNRQDQSG